MTTPITLCGFAVSNYYNKVKLSLLEKGVPFTNKFARYKMPSIKHTPEIASFIIEDPAADGPYGAKGVGEISSIPTTPAITNAIFEACGVRVTRLPVDQDLLLLTMKARN